MKETKSIPDYWERVMECRRKVAALAGHLVIASLLVGACASQDSHEPADWTVTELAGAGALLQDAPAVAPGFRDGPASEARFDRPLGLAVAPDGSLYIADSGNRRIRKLTPSGQVETVAGSGDAGTTDGAATEASFRTPVDVALGADGTLYVVDAEAAQIRSIRDGQVSTVAGVDVVACQTALMERKESPSAPLPEGCPEVAGQATYRDGSGATALFNQPSSVAVSPSGELFVADSSNQVVRRIALDGAVSTLVGGPGQPGSSDGEGTAARFFFPVDLAIDADGNLWLTEGSRVRQIASGVATTIAGSREEGMGAAGYEDGPAESARFNGVTGLAVSSDGSLVLADTGNQRIRLLSGGTVATIAGKGGQGMGTGPGAEAQFSHPAGIAAFLDGTVAVSDYNLNRIFLITRSGE